MIHSIEEVEVLGGWQLLLADPGWKYRRATGRGAAANHYTTSKAAEIAALPVSRIAAKNAVLFLWCTWPILLDDEEDAVRHVVHSWGFRLKTLGFLWVKTNKRAGTPFWGGGSWTRANSEICLLCVRGNVRAISKSVHQLIESWEDEVPDRVLRAPHPDVSDGESEHSVKPAEVRERIVSLCGDLPRIELYARERVNGWDAWGNDKRLGGSDVDLSSSSLTSAQQLS